MGCLGSLRERREWENERVSNFSKATYNDQREPEKCIEIVNTLGYWICHGKAGIHSLLPAMVCAFQPCWIIG